MLRRVAEVDTLGELDVLTAATCDDVTARVLALRDSWTSRAPGGRFSTLGANAYMDLARSENPTDSYHGPAARANGLLAAQFGDVHDALAAALTEALHRRVRYADDLALPGFHIWTAEGIPQHPTASVHFDLQYQRLIREPPYSAATGTVSFTLPIRLPAAGSSLRVWPDIRYPRDDRTVAAHAGEPLVIPYHPGRALVHSGHVLHQIGVTPTVRPDDLRITMQGHGLVIGDEVVLYW